MPVLLVTGGARGIGADIAVLGAERGWDVVVNYVNNRAAAEEVCAKIEGLGRRALPLQADVSDESAVTGMFDEAQAELGRVDGLVNNAGIPSGGAIIDEVDIENVRRVVEVNYIGTYLCCRSAVMQMSKERGGGGGSIVNISSAATRSGGAASGLHYAGSKAAVDTLTIGLARQQAAAGIRVNSIRPGITRTDMVINAAAQFPDWYEQTAANVPLGYVAEVRDISASAIWLLSDEASYVTGAILDVSGGMAMP